MAMQVAETIKEMKRLRLHLPEPLGFVPTMGYLHKGHLSLARRAREENASVVASIFVNPTQFGPTEDFEDYPRDTKRDLAMLEEAKTDVVFMPPAAEMYPEGFSSWVEVGKLTERLEGAARPTHFRGVTTICNKLFNIVEPTRAYFGQKDAQQALVIKKMVADLNMNLEIVVCPTAREPDGLAMSSRHVYLSPEQRQAAVSLYEALKLAEELWSQGERNAERLRQVVTNHIRQQPLAEIEYVSVVDTETLEELETVTSSALLSLVVRFGKTRLLDNTILR
jgi:pantoate--beta-alanine ligase